MRVDIVVVAAVRPAAPAIRTIDKVRLECMQPQAIKTLPFQPIAEYIFIRLFIT
jgi:hypothetical protein